MRRKQTPRASAGKHKCGECSRSYGHCSPSLATGKMLMCLCKHYNDAEHYILCSKQACQAFRPKC